MKTILKQRLYLLSLLIVCIAFTHSSCENEEVNQLINQGGEPPVGIIKLYTSDGGETWEGHTIWPFPDAIAYDISSDGPGMLRIVGQQRVAKDIIGMVLRSTDAGDSWRKEAENLNFDVLNSVFSSFYTTVAGRNSSMVLTTNNGVSWSYASLNSSDIDFKSVAYNIEGTVGIGVGNCVLGTTDTSYIYRSIDLGQTWQKISTKLFYLDMRNFNDVVFTAYTDAIAVSDWGSFMRTTNTGLNWFPSYASEINSPLYRLSVAPNSTIGISVGAHGRIMKTNSLQSWSSIESGVESDLFDVVCINPNLAFAVGKGVILKSINGGNSWTQKTVPYDFKNSTLRAVYFYDSNHGYIVGGD